MPVLLNPKHELFAQSLATGKTQEQAYVVAGYSAKTARQGSTNLFTKPNISKRVQELQSRAAIKAEIEIEDILLELEHARLIAKDRQNPSAMISATMGKAKLLGLITDKSKTELSGKNNEPLPNLLFMAAPRPNTYTYDEWKQIEADHKILDDSY